VRAADGKWTVNGWSAAQFVTGAEPDHRQTPRWAEIVGAGRALHRALAPFSQPEFVRAADSRWAVADRIAWGEQSSRLLPELAAVAVRLRPALTSLGPDQLVHGDLTGNVLFADGLPPAVIDLSLYWRPCPYADGVVVADALCWHEAPRSLASDLRVPIAAVARALLFRIATTQERVNASVKPDLLGLEVDRYGWAATALGL
jgi:Ser/Thr protein kinase RdoA (MazF antagonist)